MEDQQILELLHQRSETAITALRQRFGIRLYQTAYNILGSHPDAEEVTNDTYLALWDAIPPEQPNNLAGFVYQIGRNLALKRLRYLTAEKRDSRSNLSLDELAFAIGCDSPEETINTQELAQSLNRFLGTLSKENRDLFLRRYWFGDSVSDLAAATGLRENALSVRLLRLRNKLKQHLQKEGLTHEP